MWFQEINNLLYDLIIQILEVGNVSDHIPSKLKVMIFVFLDHPLEVQINLRELNLNLLEVLPVNVGKGRVVHSFCCGCSLKLGNKSDLSKVFTLLKTSNSLLLLVHFAIENRFIGLLLFQFLLNEEDVDETRPNEVNPITKVALS